MNISRILVVLTIVNLGLLIFQLAQTGQAQAENNTPILRGRALEIVDEHGKVRASLQIQPGGKTFSESVILRLIDSRGQPSVKLLTSEEGAGLSLGSKSDSAYVTLEADEEGSAIKLKNRDTERRIEP